MSSPSPKEYLWAELGTLLGAVLAIPPAWGVLYLLFRVFGPSITTLEDLVGLYFTVITIGALAVIVGGSLGCWFSLRKAGYPGARKAAGMLLLLLLVTYLAAFASTGPGFDFQYEDVPAKFLPLGTLVPLAMPLLAVWITGVAPSSLKIQALALLLAGLGAFVFFASPNDFFPPEPEVTPTAEEEAPTPSQLPLGRGIPAGRGRTPMTWPSLRLRKYLSECSW